MLDIDYERFIRERISNLRVKANVSARDMSLSIGQNESYINSIENGKILPSIRGLIYICEYFGISLKEFFDEENTNPKLIQDINIEFKRLNNKQLELILELVENFNNWTKFLKFLHNSIINSQIMQVNTNKQF